MANYDTLITYDIEKRNDDVHSFVKECMEKKGYFDAFIRIRPNGAKRIIWLPNTTLWKSNITATQAHEDLIDCLKQYEAKSQKKHELEKCLATEFTTKWSAQGEEATAEQLKKYPEKS